MSYIVESHKNKTNHEKNIQKITRGPYFPGSLSIWREVWLKQKPEGCSACLRVPHSLNCLCKEIMVRSLPKAKLAFMNPLLTLWVPENLGFCSNLCVSLSGVGMGMTAPVSITAFPAEDGSLQQKVKVYLRIPNQFQASPPCPSDESIKIEERQALTIYST